MAAAYSMDLRERVMKDADAGLASKELAARYHVSRAWVDALKQRQRESGSIAPRKQTKFRRRVLDGQDDRLKTLILAQPDATLAELRDALKISVGLATIWRAINQLGVTFKETRAARQYRATCG
jgi:transposase